MILVLSVNITNKHVLYLRNTSGIPPLMALLPSRTACLLIHNINENNISQCTLETMLKRKSHTLPTIYMCLREYLNEMFCSVDYCYH